MEHENAKYYIMINDARQKNKIRDQLLYILIKYGDETNINNTEISFSTNYGKILIGIHMLASPLLNGCMYIIKSECGIFCRVEVLSNNYFNKITHHRISIEEEDNILAPFEELLEKLTKKEDIIILNYKELQSRCYLKPAK